jgi:sugar fermentation stimulation protein A
LQATLGDHVHARPHTPFDSTDRMVRHLGELGRSLAVHQRAILLMCFLYDNPGFGVLPSKHHRAVKSRVAQAIRRGVELWQANFAMDQTGARVLRYYRLDPQLIGQPTRHQPTDDD